MRSGSEAAGGRGPRHGGGDRVAYRRSHAADHTEYTRRTGAVFRVRERDPYRNYAG